MTDNGEVFSISDFYCVQLRITKEQELLSIVCID